MALPSRRKAVEMNKWQPPETAPRDRAFKITTAGPQIDICAWNEKSGQFEDYFHRQRILPKWPYMVAWAELGDPAKVGNSEAESRAANGFPSIGEANV